MINSHVWGKFRTCELSQSARVTTLAMRLSDDLRFKFLSEQWGEDPLIVAIDSVVVEDRIVLAATRDADKRSCRIH